MRVCVISDHEAISGQVREALLREGHDCAAANVVSTRVASKHVAVARPDVAVVVLSPDPEAALGLLAELRSTVPNAVVVFGPTNEPKLILRALREGADHYLDENDVESELRRSLARLHAGDSKSSESGRVISLLAPSGGSGSSTLAVNIATVLAKNRACLLFDLKLDAGDLAALLDLKPTYTFADLSQHVLRMDRIMFERSLVSHASGVHLLAAPQTYADATLVTVDGVRHALSLARTLFPYVVVDLDHTFREEQTLVLRQSDVVLLILRLDFASLRNTHRTIEHLDRLGVDRERLRLVVNRYGQPKEITAAKAEEALGVKISHYIPDDPKSVNRANNNGVPFVLESPSTKISKCISRLAYSVNGLHTT